MRVSLILKMPELPRTKRGDYWASRLSPTLEEYVKVGRLRRMLGLYEVRNKNS